MKAFVINVNKCSGCYCCQLACKDEHVGNDWSPYAKPQPNTGQFWGKIYEYLRGQVPKVKMSYVFVPCQHCNNAPCVAWCPVKAISIRNDGLVIIDPKKCTGCKICVDACPYQCIFFNDPLQLAQKCTGCAHLLDRGWPITTPRCVDVCWNDVISFGEDSELSSLIGQSEKLHPEFNLDTRVHYIGLPKRFIAGTVYDPNKKEVVIGATCTLSGDGSGTTTTDDWGDFWFEGLKVGTFSVKIEAAGKTVTKTSISTEKDVSLGDIPLS